MSHLLYLMFRFDFDVMESLEGLEKFGGSEQNPFMDGGDSYPHPTRCLLLL